MGVFAKGICLQKATFGRCWEKVLRRGERGIDSTCCTLSHSEVKKLLELVVHKCFCVFFFSSGS